MAGRFYIFDRSIRKYDSELEYESSFLAHRLLGLSIRSLAIIGMYPLQNGLAVREALLRVKFPNSVAFL